MAKKKPAAPPMVTVKFTKDYVASRGPGIAGVKGVEKTFRKSDALDELIESGVVEIVKTTKAETRQTATRKPAETS